MKQETQGWMDWISSFFYSPETSSFENPNVVTYATTSKGIMNIFSHPEFQSKLKVQREKMEIEGISNCITSPNPIPPHETLKRKEEKKIDRHDFDDFLKQMKKKTDQIRKSIEGSSP